MSGLAALGVVADVVGLLSFALDAFPDSEGPNVKFNFYVGLDGAQDPNDPNSPPLSSSGGTLPDIRIWQENAEFIKILTNDNSNCADGSVSCEATIEDVEVQPTYTLFTANTDAMCIAYSTVTFPGDTSRYATTLGAWARVCSNAYPGRGGTWYWSDVYVQPEEGESFKTECAWIDGNGDQPTTGISLHWPEYDGVDGVPDGSDLNYFCNNDPVLAFHTDSDPSGIAFWTRKRNVFSTSPSVGLATTPANIMIKRQEANEAKAKRLSNNQAQRLVKSKYEGHTAKQLCEAKTSAGPSFTSYADRYFCHMETKTLYAFCEDVQSGACWDDAANNLKVLGEARIAAGLPSLNFTQLTNWG